MNRRVLVAVVVLLVTSTLVSAASPAAAAAQLTLTPATGLVDLQPVEAHVSGVTPGEVIGACQTISSSTRQFACAPGTTTIGTSSDDGTVSLTVIVRRFVFIPSSRRTIDCADPAESCSVGAAEPLNVPATAVTKPISFARPPPPPATRGSISVKPATDIPDDDFVTVEGTGFRPDVAVLVVECRADPHDPTECWSTYATAQTDATGSFTSRVQLSRAFDTETFLIDCHVSACVVTASEVLDFPSTVATAPIAFQPLTVVMPGAATVLEGDNGTTVLEIPVTLSHPSTDTVTVEWTTVFDPAWSAVAAQPGVDYQAMFGILSFGPGDIDQTVRITITGDVSAELDELIVVSFRNPWATRMGGFWGLGFGGITDDD